VLAAALTGNTATAATFWGGTGTTIDHVATTVQLLTAAYVQFIAGTGDAVDDRPASVSTRQIAGVVEDHPTVGLEPTTSIAIG
jgi:hypothetical protein